MQSNQIMPSQAYQSVQLALSNRLPITQNLNTNIIKEQFKTKILTAINKKSSVTIEPKDPHYPYKIEAVIDLLITNDDFTNQVNAGTNIEIVTKADVVMVGKINACWLFCCVRGHVETTKNFTGEYATTSALSKLRILWERHFERNNLGMLNTSPDAIHLQNPIFVGATLKMDQLSRLIIAGFWNFSELKNIEELKLEPLSNYQDGQQLKNLYDVGFRNFIDISVGRFVLTILHEYGVRNFNNIVCDGSSMNSQRMKEQGIQNTLFSNVTIRNWRGYEVGEPTDNLCIINTIRLGRTEQDVCHCIFSVNAEFNKVLPDIQRFIDKIIVPIVHSYFKLSMSKGGDGGTSTLHIILERPDAIQSIVETLSPKDTELFVQWYRYNTLEIYYPKHNICYDNHYLIHSKRKLAVAEEILRAKKEYDTNMFAKGILAKIGGNKVSPITTINDFIYGEAEKLSEIN